MVLASVMVAVRMMLLPDRDTAAITSALNVPIRRPPVLRTAVGTMVPLVSFLVVLSRQSLGWHPTSALNMLQRALVSTLAAPSNTSKFRTSVRSTYAPSVEVISRPLTLTAGNTSTSARTQAARDLPSLASLVRVLADALSTQDPVLVSVPTGVRSTAFLATFCVTFTFVR